MDVVHFNLGVFNKDLETSNFSTYLACECDVLSPDGEHIYEVCLSHFLALQSDMGNCINLNAFFYGDVELGIHLFTESEEESAIATWNSEAGIVHRCLANGQE